MFDILNIILPVFLLIGAGYAARFFHILSDDQCDGLMRFCIHIAIPVLLFKNLAVLNLSTAFHLPYLLTFYAGTVSSFVIGILLGRFVFNRTAGASVAVGFAGTFANLVLLGWPLVERAYGSEAVQPVIAIVALHAPVCYFLGITTMEIFRADGRSRTETLRIVSKSMFSNALMIGIVLGLLTNVSGVNLPDLIQVPVDMLARTAAPVAIFALGGILVRYAITERVGELGALSAIRLFWHPLTAYVLGRWLFDLPHEVLQAIVLASAMPAGMNSYVFAAMYRRAEGTAAGNVLVSTALSILSISIWLFILQS